MRLYACIELFQKDIYFNVIILRGFVIFVAINFQIFEFFIF